MENFQEPNFDVLKAISVLAKKLEKSHLKIKRTNEFNNAEEKLNKYFDTTSSGTWMLCGILSYYFEHHGSTCNFNDLSDFFDCPVMSVIAYKKDIEDLLAKRYIVNNKSLIEDEVEIHNEFDISKSLIRSVIHNDKIIIEQKKTERSILDLIRKVGDLCDSSEEMFEKTFQTEAIEYKYCDFDFIKKVKLLFPDDINTRLFFYGCCNDLLKGYASSLQSTIECSYGESDRFQIAESFMEGNHPLLKMDLVEFVDKSNLTESTIEITAKAKEMFLGENAKLFMKSAKGTDIIQPDTIKQKELFYSLENESEINRLTNALNDENLFNIQTQLVEKGYQKGIAVLLYGAPGTGKTETVYQIAKKTGRKILHVDISSTKSCWFGESEKIMKKIFVDYKNLCKLCRDEKDGKIPILLFNEADGILSKRKDSTMGSASQVENTIQNIILEEMERLEGIMIATTNLANNLDAAFERRFLFKIKFENPTIEAKAKIWKSKLNWLPENEIEMFASNFDLSGGQIDNIVRKATMDEILTGKRPEYEELLKLCKKEKLGEAERKIGFF